MSRFDLLRLAGAVEIGTVNPYGRCSGRTGRSLRSLSRSPLNGSIVGQTGANVEKDDRILAALACLRDRFGESIEPVDHWAADLLAIGISRRGEGTRLVYLSVLPDQDGRFDVALELPPKVGSDLPYEDGGWRRGLNLSEVSDVVALHLKLG